MFSFMDTDDPDSAETQVSFLLSLASLIIEVLTLNTNIYIKKSAKKKKKKKEKK